jgi:hypothetical protein
MMEVKMDIKAMRRRQSSGQKLFDAAKAVQDDVCGLLCPSVFKTGQEPPHHPKCVELRKAILAVEHSRLVG